METLILQKQLSYFDVLNYLTDNSEIFVPPLAPRVNLEVFATKISENATHIVAINNAIILGFMACYFNDPDLQFGYITTISVLPQFQGKGIAVKLIDKAVDIGKKRGFKKLRLEVHDNNVIAYNFYYKYGFKVNRKFSDSKILEFIF